MPFMGPDLDINSILFYSVGSFVVDTDLNKQYKVSLSRILNNILELDHIL